MSRWAEVMEQVVRERRPALVGYAYLMCGSRADAEDIVQEAIVRTFARGRAKTSVLQAEGYIRRSIANEVIDRSRRARTARSRRAVVAVPDQVPSHDLAVAASADLAAALANLTTRERTVVVLKYVDDLTVAQIAARLGVVDGTVKRYLSNAAEKLRGLMEDDANPTEDRHEFTPVIVLEGSVA